MSDINNRRSHFMLFCLFLLLLLALPGLGQAAPARERGARQTVPSREQGGRHDHEFMDSRYGHNRYYPSRGLTVRAVPRDAHEIVYGGARYSFTGGVWYRRAGAHFIVAAPPIGMIIPFLPPFYATIWVGGLPYYYANDVYYTRGADGYVVVAPPQSQVSQTPPVSPPPADSQLFIYPRQGQSEKQQADDRYACHSWAVNQTGYDPTQPTPDMTKAPENPRQNRASYQRAMSACLEGRGYTVK
jgi:hypothetical protein